MSASRRAPRASGKAVAVTVRRRHRRPGLPPFEDRLTAACGILLLTAVLVLPWILLGWTLGPPEPAFDLAVDLLN